MLNRRLFIIVFPLLVARVAPAQTVPATINYQGRLTDNTPAQTPLSATVPMQFAIYDAATLGARLWQEPAANNTGTPVAVNGGIFNYLLGNTVAIPASLFAGATSVRYLQITLNPAASPEILAPRQLITATGYANLAQNANTATTATSATTAATAGNSTQLGGVAASGYLLTSGTAADSNNLGGAPAANYQKRTAASAFTCPAGQALQSAAADGAPVCMTPAVTGPMLFGGQFGILAGNATQYWNVTGSGGGAVVNNAIWRFMPAACTANSLFVIVFTNGASGQPVHNLRFTLGKNVAGAFVPGALTCTVANSATQNTITTCSDTAHTVAYAQGEQIVGEFVDQTATPTPQVTISSSVGCR